MCKQTNTKPEELLLYAVTDRHWLNGATLISQVEAALKGGATFIQLREKNLDDEAFYKEALEIQKLCRNYKVPFVINDNVELAKKIAKSVLRSGRTSTLEPMNPYERRIIHAAVSEIEGVTSKSIGEEPYRRVVISSVNGRPERKGNSQRRGNGKPRQKREPYSMDLMKTSFEKDYKKPKPEDSMFDGELYGKIDL